MSSPTRPSAARPRLRVAGGGARPRPYRAGRLAGSVDRRLPAAALRRRQPDRDLRRRPARRSARGAGRRQRRGADPAAVAQGGPGRQTGDRAGAARQPRAASPAARPGPARGRRPLHAGGRRTSCAAAPPCPCRARDRGESARVLARRPISGYLHWRERRSPPPHNRRVRTMAWSTLRSTPPISFVPFLGRPERGPVVAVLRLDGVIAAARDSAAPSISRAWRL